MPTLREDKVRYGLSKDMRVIEIGASYNPIVAKRDGWKVWTIDHASKEELVKKYTPHSNVDVSRIEDVDFVWSGQELSEVVPADMHRTFDAIVSSHVIEHIPDFIGFFKASSKLLKSDGLVRMAIPDKRFCFDWFRPHSTTGQIIEAHRSNHPRHRIAAHFDHQAYVCTNDNGIAWGQAPIGKISLITADFDTALKFINSLPSDQYVDCHGWQFIPASFELIITELTALGIIDFEIEKIFPSEGCEFIAHLRKSAGPTMDSTELAAKRLNLLHKIVEELGVQADYQRASAIAANQ